MSRTSKKIIELVNVKKRYRVGVVITWALRGVNLVVYQGEFIAIMGPSGSGKTTLLNMVGLLDVPTEGKIFIDNIETSKLKSKQLARIRNRKIGFVFQTFNLINRLTVLENIELPLVVRSIPRKKRIEKATQSLIMAGGDPSWMPKHPNQLSGGQQQRVAIARAIVGDPELILADEPTGNLDRKSAKTVVETFVKLNSRGQTILMVTHDPEVAHCAHKIYILRDGVIVKEEKPIPEKCIINTVA